MVRTQACIHGLCRTRPLDFTHCGPVLTTVVLGASLCNFFAEITADEKALMVLRDVSDGEEIQNTLTTLIFSTAVEISTHDYVLARTVVNLAPVLYASQCQGSLGSSDSWIMLSHLEMQVNYHDVFLCMSALQDGCVCDVREFPKITLQVRDLVHLSRNI